MKHEEKKHFDISKPRKHRPDPTSKPIIVGHHPMMPDPMIREEREKATKPIKVAVEGDKSEPVAAEKPTKEDKIPDLSDISAPHETSPALTPSAAAPESTPGAVFTPSGPTPEASTSLPEPKMPETTMPPTPFQPLPPTATPPTPPELPAPTDSRGPDRSIGAGEELHIPAGKAVLHHKPRIWVWVVVAIIVLVWTYAAIDALTATKLPIEFFKKSEPAEQQLKNNQPANQIINNATTASQPFQLPDGWTWYENKEIGFKFAYPESLGELKFADQKDGRSIGVFMKNGQSSIWIIRLHKKTIQRFQSNDPFINLYGYKVDNGSFARLEAGGSEIVLASQNVLASSTETNRSYLVYRGESQGYFLGGFGKIGSDDSYNSVIFDYSQGRDDRPFNINDSEVQQMITMLKSFESS